jgi:hypothetical protein
VARLLVPQPVDVGGDVGDPRAREQRGHQLLPRVTAGRIDQLVVAPPRRGRGGLEGRPPDDDAALAEAARQEVKVQVDQRLAGIEGDNRG